MQYELSKMGEELLIVKRLVCGYIYEQIERERFVWRVEFFVIVMCLMYKIKFIYCQQQQSDINYKLNMLFYIYYDCSFNY